MRKVYKRMKKGYEKGNLYIMMRDGGWWVR